MLRKTMIVLAKAAALTSGLTVEAFAHGGGRGHGNPLSSAAAPGASVDRWTKNMFKNIF